MESFRIYSGTHSFLLIYIYDLTYYITNSTVQMFVDDATLAVSGKTVPEIESKINLHLYNAHK